MRRAEALLAQYPGPVTLHASWQQWTAVLVFCAAAAIVGVYAAVTQPTSDDVLGYWLAAAFFGSGALISLALLWRGGNSLTLTADGFQWLEILLRVSVSWEHASRFEAFDDSIDGGWLPNMRVRFHLDYPGTPLPDPDVTVPDRYGLKAEELAWLLNAWRAKALDAKRTR